MQIKTTLSFIKQSNSLFKKNPYLREKFKKVIQHLTVNPFTSSLKTHKLSGDLKDFWSCSITYEIRLRFKIVDEVIELIDIGSHDEVY
ncbi:MAG: type II toxin-antitoxin system mRNA interferase toxin, RelE/StbE family [Nitrospirae bacterium]|nr:type II toxin-antitoxin system mRNA interferase toxin, RelE/StbE family [Nitrospirota bacterium]MBF0540534.1 type II toxin-antitoxin system mRNA interferase toxin, RelE/StbE family [Nitrospirota bacterium]